MSCNSIKLNVITLNQVYLNVATLGNFDVRRKGGAPDTPEGCIEFLVDEGTFLVDEGAFLVLT